MPLSQAPIYERSVQYVKGVGPRRAKQLAELGVLTLEDACYFAPRRYEDRTRMARIAELNPGDTATLQARIVHCALRRLRGGRNLTEAKVQDDTGALQLVWFNQAYLAQQLKPGRELILYGKVEERGRLQMVHPEIELVGEDEVGLHAGRIVPIYGLTFGITQRWMRKLIAQIVDNEAHQLAETLPAALLQKQGWPGVVEAVRELHRPASWETLETARQRLAFEELLVLQMALAQRKAKNAAICKPQAYRAEGELSRALAERLPFALTKAQQRVLAELKSDLLQPYPMQRLVQGDVGCGKTIVMVCLLALAVQSGYQVAVMAPTELLADQHAKVLEGLLAPLGVTVALLSQGVPLRDRKATMERVAQGDCDVVVGTHALLQDQVKFKTLSLAVIDEQHKFGVQQRTSLTRKAEAADVLVMSATPIPRTLALSLYGDLSISTIDELPPGRRPVRTLWIREAQRVKLYERMREELSLGRQGYVVYPLVEQKDTSDLKAATQMADALQQDFSGFSVGLIHGQMASKEKDAVMRAYAANEVQLLVSTVVIEVGIDVTNATMMVIEHPERFGLAQLHQLRGRIGRGAHPARCVLIGEVEEDVARRRLEAFVGTTDGFVLAEKDLELRGPGELVGFRQHGWAPFRIADLARDRQWLETAHAEARAIVEADPACAEPELWPLRDRLKRFQTQSSVT